MGKRKKSSRTPQGPKKREPLAAQFKCVFCNHETSVTVKIDKKGGLGNLSCKQCQANFQTGVNYLTQPVDVYADWIDACEEVAEKSKDDADGDFPQPSLNRQSQPSARARTAPTQNDNNDKYAVGEEEDGFLVDDEADAEGAYEDD